jgi:hypothetical protein
MNKTLFALIAVALGAAACGSTPIKGKPMGGAAIYSEVQFNELVTQEGAVGTKRGEACATNILGIIATGDASAATAAKKAGIARVGVVDGMHSNILGVYSKYCVVVSGE